MSKPLEHRDGPLRLERQKRAKGNFEVHFLSLKECTKEEIVGRSNSHHSRSVRRVNIQDARKERFSRGNGQLCQIMREVNQTKIKWKPLELKFPSSRLTF